MAPPLIKYCGLSSTEDIDDAIRANVHYIGFIHHPASPRHLTLDEIDELSRYAKKIRTVAVLVNPDDKMLQTLKKQPLTHIQLHGNESPERCKNVQFITGKHIIKACSIHNKQDVQNALAYEPYVDHILFDAKTPNPDMPGGVGASFDWSLLKDITLQNPWFLAGGLDRNNVDKALDISDAPMLDISSGIESSTGVKDHIKMMDFMNHIAKRAS